MRPAQRLRVAHLRGVHTGPKGLSHNIRSPEIYGPPDRIFQPEVRNKLYPLLGLCRYNMCMPFARSFQTKMDSEVNGSVDENPDNVLELAIDFAVRGRYPPGLSKDKKRAVRRRATTLRVDKGSILEEERA